MKKRIVGHNYLKISYSVLKMKKSFHIKSQELNTYKENIGLKLKLFQLLHVPTEYSILEFLFWSESKWNCVFISVIDVQAIS